MKFLLDELGEPASGPDDFYMGFGMPITEWIQKTDQNYLAGQMARFEQLLLRIEKVIAAWELYKTAPHFDSKDLRHEPHVIENYTPTEDADGLVERYFIFKQDNNGTTYRILDED